MADHAAGPTLTIWIYDSALGAAAGEVRLKDLQKRNALQVHDEVTVTWMPGAHQPRIGHLRYETSAVATRGSVLGGLVGLMFLAPVTGSAGAGLADLAHQLRGSGIDQTFLEEVKAHLRPESSALLVLSGKADLDEVRPVIERGLARGDVVLMHALLQDTAEEILQAAVRELQNRSTAGIRPQARSFCSRQAGPRSGTAPRSPAARASKTFLVSPTSSLRGPCRRGSGPVCSSPMTTGEPPAQ